MAEHVDNATVEVLRAFAKYVVSSSIRERMKVLSELSDCCTDELPEKSVTGIVKYLGQTLGYYRDSASRTAVTRLISLLLKLYPAVSLKAFISVLSPYGIDLCKLAAHYRGSSGAALTGLKWTAVLVRTVGKNPDHNGSFSDLVKIQLDLVCVALASGNPAICKSTEKCLHSIWKQDSTMTVMYADTLRDFNLTSHNLCLASVLLKYQHSNKQVDAQFKTVALDCYIKNVIGNRVKMPSFLFSQYGGLLRLVTHDEFKDKVLPAAQKAILRNPEIILVAFKELMNSVTLDLSVYSRDIIKILAAQLISKSNDTRTEACGIVRNLAHQCSDWEAVEAMASHLFSVLSGSEGKLSIMEQKLTVSSAIGHLSENVVRGSSTLQNLSSSVVEMWIAPLQQETHEGTLVHYVQCLSLWCAKFTEKVPDKLIQWFKNVLTAKTSTSAVRSAYITCIAKTFHGESLLQCSSLIDTLLLISNKVSQSNQAQYAAESLTAACVLVQLSSHHIDMETTLAPFWKSFLNTNAKLFLSIKFLNTASEEGLQNVISLVTYVLLHHPQRLTTEHNTLFYEALIFCATRRTWSVRKAACDSIHNLTSIMGGASVALDMVDRFLSMVATEKLTCVINMDDIETDGSPPKLPQPKDIAVALSTMSSVDKAENDTNNKMALRTLIPAHHPYLRAYRADCWEDIMRRLGLDCQDFVSSHIDECFTLILNSPVPLCQTNAVQTLVRVCPSVVIPKLIGIIEKPLSNNDYINVTPEQYQIFLTAEGVLYNKSVIESVTTEEVEEKNIKRESKAYTYKEQMDGIALKKELAKMSKKKDKPTLTKKQQDLMTEELKIESAIRASIQVMHKDLTINCSLLDAAIAGSPVTSCDHMVALCRIIIPLLKSPVAAPICMKTFEALVLSAFGADDKLILGSLLSYCTLRHLKPASPINPNWCKEPLDKQTQRVLKHLTTTKLTTSCFTVLFYLLRCLLESSDNSASHRTAIEHISTYAQIRSSKDDLTTRSDPAFLPIHEIIVTLTTIIKHHAGKIQKEASYALEEMSRACGGGSGCTTLSQEDLNVILDCLVSPVMTVRDSALRSLIHLVTVFPNEKDNQKAWLYLSRRLWVASNDVDAEIVQLANSILEMCGMKTAESAKAKKPKPPPKKLTLLLIGDVTHEDEVIRTAACDTLYQLVVIYQQLITQVLQQLLDQYEQKLFIQSAKYDDFKRLIREASRDLWGSRCGIALALNKLSPLVPTNQITTLFEFYISRSLSDRHETVRSMMRDASLTLVNDHGKDNVATLLPLFERKFDNVSSKSTVGEYTKQSLVVLMGSMARHLDTDNPKIKPIVSKLIKALNTPSQAVQEAVANCLYPLVPSIKDDAPNMVKTLMNQLLQSDTYGVRRGAAYGIAGLIKGLGIMSLKQLDIMTTLIEAIQNKKNVKQREGALFAFEMLCIMLGKLFEPYVVHILPNLLLCFGDNNSYVRQAADDTAKAVMSKLSGHGVKLVLPSLLKALDEDSWRTKTGSVELLGAMAFCAPKQLSACLPSIVPKLMEVLADSHQKVQQAGAQALKMIGSVIRNPEIQEIVTVLLEALQDPTKKTNLCLQALLDTQFVHFIDAPSLALIMPIVQRAFQDRSTETRKMAAQIIGNMYSLTDQKDLSPYLSTVIPGLKQSLLDPVPDVRSVSARAIGAIVKGMGEEGYKDLLPWLLSMLTSEGSSVDRSGAAQGFSEVIGGMGLEKLETIMPDIIQMSERSDIAPHERDGYIMTYIYLPTVFNEDFIPYVGPILPSILKALSDECEFVRDTALRAGQRIINLYSGQAIQLLMPELESGLFDDNWRIRYSSVQLLGDLLYRISGVSGKMTTESASEDDNFGTETSQQALLDVLGDQRRNRVLSGLYMGRSDVALQVRQSALHVWKVIVSNTPRTLRTILPTLFGLLLSSLASSSYDRRKIAGRTLGDLVSKLGERVLPEIIPILEDGLESSECVQRQGVCIGLSEIMAATSREHVMVFADSLIPSVQRALSDPLQEVRTAAARTFDNLHNNIGQRALDTILPYLLNNLENEEKSEFALDGLKQIVVTKSHVVLPNLIPQLIAPPVNTKALALLSSVAGDNLTRHLTRILPALLSSLNNRDAQETDKILEHCKTVVLSVSGEVGVRTVIEELSSAATNKKSTDTQAAAITILGYFCQLTRNDYADYLPMLFRVLIQQLIKIDTNVLLASWECIFIITKKLDPSEMLQYIFPIRQAIKFTSSDLTGDTLPGFCLPKKGIIPLLPIFREGILNGSPEMRESAAIGLGEMIKLTSKEGLQPSVLNITGPLIRILGDRFTHQVKIALLETLTLLLDKVGALLKPFLPQLQTTFIKALNDPHRTVRLRAGAALGCLITIHVRVDQLFVEILTAVKNSETKTADSALSSSMRDTMLQALRVCLQGGGAKMSDAIRKQVTAGLLPLLGDPSDTTRSVTAGCVGGLCGCLPDDEFNELLNTTLLDIDESRDWTERHSRSIALYVALKICPDKLYTDQWRDRVIGTLTHHINSDRIPICLSGLRCAGYLMTHQQNTEGNMSQELVSILLKVMKRESNDVKQLVCQVITYIAQSQAPTQEVTRTLIPSLVNATKEKNTVVKSNAEIALFVLLKMAESDDYYKEMLTTLDLGMQDALKDVISKSVKKLKTKFVNKEEIDDTMLI